tara:strand:+ start:2085 stop:2705 length:621 start_codon:yes stop_codon:yes gene_type:complete
MTRPNSTNKESNNNYEPANATGAAVRAAIKDVFGALRTLNAGSGDPSGTANLAAFQPHIDSDTNTLKIRNGANNAFITLGNVGQTNFGHADLTGATFTGTVIHNYTGALRLPVGTTAQRPTSPTAGDIRFNSTTTEAEIFNGSIFTAVAGGAGATGGGNDQWVFENDITVTTNYQITANKNAHSVSPTISSGVTITVPSGSILVIL